MRRSLFWTQTAWRLLIDESGQGIVEYAVILASIAMIAFVALHTLGTKNHNSLSNSANQLPG
jgi:Flp pilus assembly pilin Flp